MKDSLEEKSEKISGTKEEGKISAQNQPQTHLPMSKTTFVELNASEWHNRESKQQVGLEDYQLKCQQPIHLSASLQGRMKKLEDVD